MKPGENCIIQVGKSVCHFLFVVVLLEMELDPSIKKKKNLIHSNKPNNR